MPRVDDRQRRTPRLKGVSPWLVSLVLILLSGAASSAWCVNYYLAIDEPAILGPTRFRPDQIVRSQTAVYFLETGLPPPTEFVALHRRPDGIWLFSPSHPVALGGVRYRPHDVVAWDGAATFALVLDGDAEGLPRRARIDALFVDRQSGNLILSFDVPVMLGAVRYGRSDLVRRVAPGAFVIFWDAGAAGVPSRANVVGADQGSTGNLVITFDIPTTIAAVKFLPGELVAWDGVAFSSYFVDAAWPRSAQLRDFSFVPAAGRLLDDGCAAAPAPPLEVTRDPATGDLTLTWGGSCLASDTDFGIYEGNLGTFYNHTAKPGWCSTGGALTATFPDPNPALSFYYLVVPRNGVREGSYGEARPAGTCGGERPAGIVQCLPQEIAMCP